MSDTGPLLALPTPAGFPRAVRPGLSPALPQALPPGYATLAVIAAMRRADSSGDATGCTM